MKRLLAIFALLIFTSFSSKLENEPLLKTWVLIKVEPGKCFSRTYKDTSHFGNKMGFTFMDNGKLIAKLPLNAWCPVGETNIRYEVVEGKWSRESDSILILEYPIYPKAEKVRITTISNNQLVLKRIFCK